MVAIDLGEIATPTFSNESIEMTKISEWNSTNKTPLIGGWTLLGPSSAEVMSFSNLDWIGLDAQHGAFDDRLTLEALHLIPRDRIDVIVRVPRLDEAWIGRVLDAGARGVIVPMVETQKDAELATRACRYPGQGTRSWGQAGGRWGRAEIDPITSNKEVVCAVMVESRTGLDNVEAIAATPGIDMIYVGPFDLSIALGIHIDELLESGLEGDLGILLDACKRNNVIPGVFAGTAARTARFLELGFEVIAAGTDVGMLTDSSNAISNRTGATSNSSY